MLININVYINVNERGRGELKRGGDIQVSRILIVDFVDFSYSRLVELTYILEFRNFIAISRKVYQILLTKYASLGGN